MLTVNSLLDNEDSDDGLVTLREAVAAANADSMTDLGEVGNGADVIRFSDDLAGLCDVWLIGDSAYGPSSLSITSDITIEGREGVSVIRRHELSPAMRVFVVQDGGELTLRSLNVRGGRSIGGEGESGLGGAAYVAEGGRLNVVASTLHGNVARGDEDATGRGGAIYIDGGEVMLLNATLSQNSVHSSTGTVAGFGATIYCLNGRLEIYNSTLFANLAEAAVPGRCVYVLAEGEGAVAELRAYNSIFAGLDSGTDIIAVADAGGQIITGGDYNLTSHSEAPFINSDKVDPQIAMLADNGGLTLTHALVVVDENHPAVDQGDPNFDPADPDGDPLTSDAVLFDQRGTPFARVIDGYGVLGPRLDRGAIEYHPTPAGPELPGDYNGDRMVNAADYTVWRNSLGQNVARWSGADGDGDQQIAMGDYLVWKSHFGDSLSDAAATTFAVTASAEPPASPPLAASEVDTRSTEDVALAADDGPPATGRSAAARDMWPAGLADRWPQTRRTNRVPAPAKTDAAPSHFAIERALAWEVENVRRSDDSHCAQFDESLTSGRAEWLTGDEWDAVWEDLASGALT